METITVNSNLSFKQYYNISLYILARRKTLWLVAALAVFMLLYVLLTKDGSIGVFTWLAVFYIVYAFLMVGVVYVKAKIFYNKIAHLRESKVYQFTDEGLKLTTETVKLEMAWASIDSAVKRRDDHLLFSAGGRNFFRLPKIGFAGADDTDRFEKLVKQKVKKTNF